MFDKLNESNLPNEGPCARLCLENGRRDLVEGTGSSKSAVSQGDAISSGGFCSPKASGNYEDKNVFSIHCAH